MGQRNTSLKSQYIWKLWGFVVFNLVLFWTVIYSGRLDLNTVTSLTAKMTAQEGLVALFAPIITVVLNGVLPSNLKASIVFWRLKNPLPGTRVFSGLAQSDPRIDIEKISKRHGSIPSDPLNQNRLWFKIYKTYENKVAVLESHKNYLLTRDLTSMSVLFLIICSVARILVSASYSLKFGYIAFLVIQYILLTIVARNYGNRFACTVLAEESV